ncbi:MAG: hypothetical protein CMJ18_14375 [Phycisphaeraceae bacterium]|nr:hypothetical protein [Phycisphaeraceae bacterium]
MGALLLLGLEGFWRGMGHHPSVMDDEALWAQQRARLSGNEHAVALIGASRTLYNLVPDVIEKRHPKVVVGNVAIEGTNPVAALRDLARDPDFHGVAICDITYAGIDATTWDEQQGHVDFYWRKYKPGKDVERRLRTLVQQCLVTVSPRTSITKFAEGVFDAKWERPFHVRVHPSRWWSGDFQRADFSSILDRSQWLRQWNADRNQGDSPTLESWSEAVDGIAKMVSRIRQRGGEVVFVCMPTSRQPWKLTDKHAAWQTLEARVGAPTIHFTDHPSLSKYVLWDASHVDERDAPAFTSALIDILEQMQVLPRGS